VCAVRSSNQPTTECEAPGTVALPARATLRLEQQPAGPGIERPDSPGWGIVGTSDEPTLKIVLSDFVSANVKPRTVTYRVTLRDESGHVLSTSNPVTITWHR
jgi:hypothetical protein